MKQVKYLNKAKIITKDNKKYILKSRKIDLENLYANLLNRGFNNYLIPERITESTEIYKYVDQLNISNSKKSQDIVYLASILHNKTTEFTELSLDEVKKICEENNIDYSKWKFVDITDEIYTEKILKKYLTFSTESCFRVLSPARFRNKHVGCGKF